MAIVGLHPDELIEYVLKCERECEPPEADPTVWLLRPLDARVYGSLMGRLAELGGDAVAEVGEDAFTPAASDSEADAVKLDRALAKSISLDEFNALVLDMLTEGLAGWRNFKVRKGTEDVDAVFQPVSEKDKRASARSLSMIPSEHRTELYGAIIRAQRPDPGDSGKS